MAKHTAFGPGANEPRHCETNEKPMAGAPSRRLMRHQARSICCGGPGPVKVAAWISGTLKSA